MTNVGSCSSYITQIGNFAICMMSLGVITDYAKTIIKSPIQFKDGVYISLEDNNSDLYASNRQPVVGWYNSATQTFEVANVNAGFTVLLIAKYKGKYAQMTQGAIRNRIKKLGKILGIEDLYPHTLRKTAINLINNLAGLGLASSYANHTSSGVTSKHYIAKANPSEIRNSIINARKKLGIF